MHESRRPGLTARPAVLDASAVLAWLKGEPGAEAVGPLLDNSVMSAVNWSEVLQILAEFDIGHGEARAASPMIEVVAFSEPQAALTAALRASTRDAGLSMADRACLSLAMLRDGPVYTGDRAWAELGLGIEVHLIR